MPVKNSIAVIPFMLLLGVATTFMGCQKTHKPVDLESRWDTTRALENPDKGWYHHLLDNGIDKYHIRKDSLFHAFPGMDHLYIRLAWAYLEPREDQYDWSYIDNIVDKYVPQGYNISFRITSKETGEAPTSYPSEVDGVGYATPYWVKQAGAEGRLPREDEAQVWTPDWDDPVFLEKLSDFYQAFAKRYDGKPWVRYVDIGSIGDWGEGHTSSSTYTWTWVNSKGRLYKIRMGTPEQDKFKVKLT